ncbi:MAG: hypothetical protein ACFE0I_06400 [Elainellaceae cyanobacterium]
MNTTDLFVEIIVIGIGGIIWLSLLIFSFLDYQWILWDRATAFISLIPFLAITYVLGIILDRIADQIFKACDKKLRKVQFSSNEEYHSARNYTYTYASEKIIGLFEYGRSRLRISRAWNINFVLIAISLTIFIWKNFTDTSLDNKLKLTFVVVSVCGFGATSSFLAWKKLAKNDYKRLKEMIDFLKQQKQKRES